MGRYYHSRGKSRKPFAKSAREKTAWRDAVSVVSHIKEDLRKKIISLALREEFLLAVNALFADFVAGFLRGNEKGSPGRFAHGHTIKFHVEKDVRYLATREQKEHLLAAGSFLDYDTAERVIKEAIQNHAKTVVQWFLGGCGQKLVLFYNAPYPVGYVLKASNPVPIAATKIVVVLKQRTRNSFPYILVAYPVLEHTPC
jgi:hypothetical protein